MRVTPFIILIFAYLIKFSFSASDTDNDTTINNDVTEDEPLILTPLIEQGEIEEARRQSLVHHEEMQDAESYAGYFTVNKECNSNMFFWYFPAQNNQTDAPVLLYLSGGPGASAMMSVFYTCPWVVTENLTLKAAEHSWHTNHHVIYLESPIGTGYSFSDCETAYVKSQAEYTRDVLPVLVQFFQLFPELRENDFYVSGESYGGKFALSTSWAIKEYNDAGNPKINLVGVVLLTGGIDNKIQMIYSDYWYETGLIDWNVRDQVKKMHAEVHELIEQDEYEEAAIVTDKLIANLFTKTPTLFRNNTGYSSFYYFNILHDQTPPDYLWVMAYSTSASLRKALHVGNVSYIAVGDKIRAPFKSDIVRSMAPVLENLLKHYRVLMLSGQMDTVVPYPRTQELMRTLDWPGVAEYSTAEKRQWRVDGQLAGYIKLAGNLTEVLVRKAGHLLCVDQPRWVWDILNKFTGGEIL